MNSFVHTLHFPRAACAGIAFAFACVFSTQVRANDRAAAGVAPEAETWESAVAATSDRSVYARFDAMNMEERIRTRGEYYAIYSVEAKKVRERMERFYLTHPSDPKRWDALMRMRSYAAHYLAPGPGVDVSDHADVPRDLEAEAEFRRRLATYEVEFDLAADVSPQLRHRSRMWRLQEVLEKGPDFAAVEAFARDFPDDDSLGGIVAHCCKTERDVAGSDAIAMWTQFARSASPSVRKIAREKLAFIELTSKPVDLSFTSTDGRAIDLRKMRGKVVLIDFWSTACGPCLAEMPLIKRLYDQYGQRGFEVVGVSCDFAPDETTVDRNNRNYGRTREQLLAFTQARGMPWPHYFEGKKRSEGSNSLAKRFSVMGIPATFVVDRSGMIVATNVHGEKLEQAIVRLLSD